MMFSQAWLCSARARSPGGSCGGQVEGGSTQAGFQLKLLDPYSDSFCFSRRALHNLSVTGALGQLAKYFRNLWCAHLQTGLKLYLRSEIYDAPTSGYAWTIPEKRLFTTINSLPVHLVESSIVFFKCSSCGHSFRMALYKCNSFSD